MFWDYLTRRWFQIFFMFTPIWGRFPIRLIFFKGVETTNYLRLFLRFSEILFQIGWKNHCYYLKMLGDLWKGEGFSSFWKTPPREALFFRDDYPMTTTTKKQGGHRVVNFQGSPSQGVPQFSLWLLDTDWHLPWEKTAKNCELQKHSGIASFDQDRICCIFFSLPQIIETGSKKVWCHQLLGIIFKLMFWVFVCLGSHHEHPHIFSSRRFIKTLYFCRGVPRRGPHNICSNSNLPVASCARYINQLPDGTGILTDTFTIHLGEMYQHLPRGAKSTLRDG